MFDSYIKVQSIESVTTVHGTLLYSCAFSVLYFHPLSYLSVDRSSIARSEPVEVKGRSVLIFHKINSSHYRQPGLPLKSGRGPIQLLTIIIIVLQRHDTQIGSPRGEQAGERKRGAGTGDNRSRRGPIWQVERWCDSCGNVSCQPNWRGPQRKEEEYQPESLVAHDR